MIVIQGPSGHARTSCDVRVCTSVIVPPQMRRIASLFWQDRDTLAILPMTSTVGMVMVIRAAGMKGGWYEAGVLSVLAISVVAPVVEIALPQPRSDKETSSKATFSIRNIFLIYYISRKQNAT